MLTGLGTFMKYQHSLVCALVVSTQLFERLVAYKYQLYIHSILHVIKLLVKIYFFCLFFYF